MYYATAEEMEKLDRLAVERGLEIRQMMELAGWHMVTMFDRLDISSGESVVVVCGKGNKGGDGLVAVRQLANYGWSVDVVMVSREISADAQHQLRLVEEMQLPVYYFGEDEAGARRVLREGDVLIDALIGYHLEGNPHGVFAEVIQLINDSGQRVVAYDLPSGLAASSGDCLEPCVTAEATLALALPKQAFRAKAGRKVSGQIWLADIGIPAYLYDQVAAGSRPAFLPGESGLIKVQ